MLTVLTVLRYRRSHTTYHQIRHASSVPGHFVELLTRCGPESWSWQQEDCVLQLPRHACKNIKCGSRRRDPVEASGERLAAKNMRPRHHSCTLLGRKRPPADTTIATTVAPCAATRARIMYCASTLLPTMNAPNPTVNTPAVVKQPASKVGGA